MSVVNKERGGWVAPPGELSKDTLDAVEWRLKSDPKIIPFEKAVAFRRHRWLQRSIGITSLRLQLPNILEFEPSSILFTAFSALPMADVFRGMYEEHSTTLPVIGMIDARAYGNTIKIPGNGLHSAEPITRDTLQRVVIVDQYVATGETALCASEMARSAGARKILPVLGKWYNDADEVALGFKTEPPSLTSNLAQPLREIGQRIAADEA